MPIIFSQKQDVHLYVPILGASTKHVRLFEAIFIISFVRLFIIVRYIRNLDADIFVINPNRSEKQLV